MCCVCTLQAFKHMDLDIYQLNEVSPDYYYLTIVPTSLDYGPQLGGEMDDRPGSNNSRLNDHRLAQVRTALERLPSVGHDQQQDDPGMFSVFYRFNHTCV